MKEKTAIGGDSLTWFCNRTFSSPRLRARPKPCARFNPLCVPSMGQPCNPPGIRCFSLCNSPGLRRRRRFLDNDFLPFRHRDEVHAMLYEAKDLRRAVHDLMTREPKPED